MKPGEGSPGWGIGLLWSDLGEQIDHACKQRDVVVSNGSFVRWLNFGRHQYRVDELLASFSLLPGLERSNERWQGGK